MNGIEKIKDRILQEAHAYGEACIKKASEEAEKILEAARQEALQKKKSVMEEAAGKSAHAARSLLARAGMDARKEKLKVKQELVEGVMRTAMEKLSSMPEDKYCEVVAEMIVHAAGEEECEILISARDKRRMGEAVISEAYTQASVRGKKLRVTLGEYEHDIPGGFILKKGDIEMNYSFEAMVRADKEELEEMVYSALGLR